MKKKKKESLVKSFPHSATLIFYETPEQMLPKVVILFSEFYQLANPNGFGTWSFGLVSVLNPI